MRSQRAALIQECANCAQPGESREVWVCSGAQQCSQLQGDEVFLSPPSGQRMKADALYLQDWFFKITTNIPRRLKTSLPRWRDEGSEAVSCSSCLKLLGKRTGGSWFAVLWSLSPSFYSGPTPFPSASWHTKHTDRHRSPDTPYGLQIPSCTAPSSQRNPLPAKEDRCFHHKTEGREKLWAKSPRKRDRNSLSLIKCAIQNLVNREMKSSCWEMEREIAFWPRGNLCL